MRLSGTSRRMLGQYWSRLQTLCGCKRGGTWACVGPADVGFLGILSFSSHAHAFGKNVARVGKVLPSDLSVCECICSRAQCILKVYKETSIESSLTLRHKTLTSSPCNEMKRLAIYMYDMHGMACLKVYFWIDELACLTKTEYLL